MSMLERIGEGHKLAHTTEVSLLERLLCEIEQTSLIVQLCLLSFLVSPDSSLCARRAQYGR